MPQDSQPHHRSLMRNYYRLTKPGIIYGNILTAVAAFIFASAQHPNIFLMISMLVGLSTTIAAACVVNNVLDRDIDLRMERTKNRAIPTGLIPVRNALWFAAVLLVVGCGTLFFFTNFLALAVTLFGVVVYVGLYTPLKRRTVHSTLIGALAGAVPPVVGYVAVTNTLDATALSLFLILVCWQMPHFFAIAIYRLKDYSEAGLPVMPVRFGILRTKIQMLIYTILFAYASYLLYVVHHLGALYAVTLSALSLGWIALSASALLPLPGFSAKDERQEKTNKWARRMFLYSLVVILLFSFVLTLS
jgi:protoheme IX farnesyltransferase